MVSKSKYRKQTIRQHDLNERSCRTCSHSEGMSVEYEIFCDFYNRFVESRKGCPVYKPMTCCNCGNKDCLDNYCSNWIKGELNV